MSFEAMFTSSDFVYSLNSVMDYEINLVDDIQNISLDRIRQTSEYIESSKGKTCFLTLSRYMCGC